MNEWANTKYWTDRWTEKDGHWNSYSSHFSISQLTKFHKQFALHEIVLLSETCVVCLYNIACVCVCVCVTNSWLAFSTGCPESLQINVGVGSISQKKNVWQNYSLYSIYAGCCPFSEVSIRYTTFQYLTLLVSPRNCHYSKILTSIKSVNILTITYGHKQIHLLKHSAY